jgi:GEVED domain/Secretion system C-terminal sorting domain
MKIKSTLYNIVFKILILLFIISFFQSGNAQTYKMMMDDLSYNFNTVCDSADAYFKTHSTGKGSGWKDYQRWKYNNFGKYYPSGDRKNADQFIAKKAYESILLSQAANKSNSSLLNNWTELGPRNIGQVTGHYAVGLGIINSFYIDPLDTMRMFIGSRSGGFWKTIDGGVTWTNTTDQLISTGVTAIAVSPFNSNTVLINVRNADNSNTLGIHRSTDGGNTWSITNFNPSNFALWGSNNISNIRCISYHPTIPNLVFIGTNHGMYRSSDNLNTATRVDSNGQIFQIKFHPTNPNVIYTCGNLFYPNDNNRILVSINAGLNFSLSDSLAGNNHFPILAIDVSPVCPNCIYAGTNNGFWKSTNMGLNFKFISDPVTNIEAFSVSDIDTAKVFAGSLDGYVSNNGGLTFNAVTSWTAGTANYKTSGNYIHADIRRTQVINGVFYAATDGFLSKSKNNGTTWRILSEGTGIRENYKIGVSQSNSARTVCGSQDNGTSIKKDNGWTEFYGGDGMASVIHPLNDDLMIGSFQYGGRLKSTDGGLSFTNASPINQVNASWVAPLLNDPNDHMVLYTFSNKVYKSTDFGNTWTGLGTPLGNTSISQAAIASGNSNIIVVAGYSGVEKSVDGGNTFTNIGIGLPNNSPSSITFDEKNDNRIIITYNSYWTTGNQIYISNNQGSTWQNITYNLGNMPIHSAVIDHTTNANIYIGTEIGVYTKSMTGTSWNLFNTNLPNTTAKDLKIVYGSNTLRAGTWGRGLWEAKLIGRDTYPSIVKTEINDNPNENGPVDGIPQFVMSKINYAGTLTSVFVKWSITSPVLSNALPMNNVGANNWKSITALPNQLIGTKVYFKVYAVGNTNDTSETYTFMYTVKPFAYCAATSTQPNSGDYINAVTLNGVTKNSLQDLYGNFTSTMINLNKCGTYNLQVKQAFHFQGDTVGAWIDFNKNANFDNSEYITMSSFNSSHISNGSFTVPANAMMNTPLRMRVRSNYYVSTVQSCGSSIYGEVEDYTIVINKAKFTSTIGACNAYKWRGITYTSSGTYKDSVINSNGCDSVFVLNLTINTTNAIATAIGNTISANIAGAAYKWINCTTNNVISGATSQNFTPIANGSYAVIITFNGCKDTSNCVNITSIGLDNVLSKNQIKVFPNPTGGNITISDLPIATTIEIYNLLGTSVYKKQSTETRQQIDMSSFTNGTYFIKLRKGTNEVYYKMVKLKE